MKSFSEFLKMRIVKKQSPDMSRARFLIEESERSVRWINDVIKK